MRLKPIIAGLVLFAAHFSLAQTVGFVAQLGLAFHFVSWREAMFWMSHYVLAVPGLLLIAYGLAPHLGQLLSRLWHGLSGLGRHRWQLAAVFYGLLLFAVAMGGRHYLLLDQPLTDDESAVTFGGRMIAEGHLRVPTPQPREALKLLFVYERDGYTSSMDFPGGLFFDALSRVSGTGDVLYAILVAVSGVALAAAGALLGGRAGAMSCAALWLLSPMVGVMAMTHHSHLLSRSLLAMALPCYLYLALDAGRRRTLAGGLLGLLAGLAFLTRPVEAACLLTPAALHLGAMAWQRRECRRPLLAAALAWGAMALVFAWYNQQITGHWLLQARFAGGASSQTGQQLDIAQRLGLNLGFNVGMLSVYLLGPLGGALIWLGLAKCSAVTVSLGWGVVLNLLVALAHDDTGIHLVGPIHYSEAAAPLILIATLGLLALFDLLAKNRRLRTVGASLLVAYGLGLVIFTATHGLTLRAQAALSRLPLNDLEAVTVRPALLIAEPPYLLWEKRPDLYEDVRSWRLRFPHPDPWLRDDVLVVYPSIDAPQLVTHFPDRAYYHLTYQEAGEPVSIERLQWVESPAASSIAAEEP